MSLLDKVDKYYAVGRQIGQGSSAKVYICKHQITGRICAMKIIDRRTKLTKKDQKHLQFEIAISKLLQHPNVVSMLQVLQSNKGIYIIQEHISGGSLLTQLKKRGKLPEVEARRYITQLFDGLAYCHSCNAAHRDLKPENLLLDSENNIKITDFGLAGNTSDNGLEEKLLFTRCGSPFYVAPEVINATDTRGYDGKKADIWSCGVILYQMLTGTFPFAANTYKVLYSLIKNCQYVEAGLPRCAADLIRRLLCPASDRLTIAQIAAHPWFMGAKSPVYPRKSLKPTEAEIASAIDPILSSSGEVDPASPFGSPVTSPPVPPLASPPASSIASPPASPSLASSPASPAGRQTRRSNACSCNNVEIQQKKLFATPTLWTNARVTILDDILHVVVKREVRSPPFPLPLSRVKSVKLHKSGDKMHMYIELRTSQTKQPKGPTRMIFVFHGTSKDDHNAAQQLHSRLSISSATKKVNCANKTKKR